MFIEKNIFNLLSGGAKKVKAGKGGLMLLGLVIALISIAIRIGLVYYSYNMVAPKLIENPKRLTLTDSLLLVILVSALFMR
jgi:cell division protein FtsX